MLPSTYLFDVVFVDLEDLFAVLELEPRPAFAGAPAAAAVGDVAARAEAAPVHQPQPLRVQPRLRRRHLLLRPRLPREEPQKLTTTLSYHEAERRRGSIPGRGSRPRWHSLAAAAGAPANKRLARPPKFRSPGPAGASATWRAEDATGAPLTSKGERLRAWAWACGRPQTRSFGRGASGEGKGNERGRGTSQPTKRRERKRERNKERKEKKREIESSNNFYLKKKNVRF